MKQLNTFNCCCWVEILSLGCFCYTLSLFVTETSGTDIFIIFWIVFSNIHLMTFGMVEISETFYQIKEASISIIFLPSSFVFLHGLTLMQSRNDGNGLCKHFWSAIHRTDHWQTFFFLRSFVKYRLNNNFRILILVWLDE